MLRKVLLGVIAMLVFVLSLASCSTQVIGDFDFSSQVGTEKAGWCTEPIIDVDGNQYQQY